MEDENQLTNLAPRKRRFVEEYLLDLNATQAAIRAGYSRNTAGSIGSELLADPQVSQEVEVAKAVRLARTRYDADRVLAEMSTLAHSDVSHYRIDDHGDVALAPGAPPDALRAIKKIKKKIRHEGKGEDASVVYDVELELWDKPGPLKLMGRHVGLFPDKVELTGKDGAPLEGMTDGQLAARAAEIAALAAKVASNGR